MSDPSTYRIEQRRRLAADPARVWAAWSDAETIAQWFTCGPGYRTEFHDWRIAVGQQFSITYYPSEDTDDVVRTIHGEFLEVEEPRHFAYRWNERATVSIDFEAVEDGTELHLVMIGPLDDGLFEIQTAGWSHCLDSFVEHASGFALEKVSL